MSPVKLFIVIIMTTTTRSVENQFFSDDLVKRLHRKENNDKKVFRLQLTKQYHGIHNNLYSDAQYIGIVCIVKHEGRNFIILWEVE